MTKLTERFNVGDKDNITNERLLDLLEEMYMQLAIAINRKPDVHFRDTDGISGPVPPGDTFLSNGDINVNTNTLKIEMLVEHIDTTTVTWKELV
jgi:hypothetical protein